MLRIASNSISRTVATPPSSSLLSRSSLTPLRQSNLPLSPRPKNQTRTAYTQRPLPEIPSRRPIILLTIVLAITSWTGFTLYATNLERLSSSAFRSCLTQVKDDERIKELVGEVVRVDQKWYLGGKPWIKGTINMMQGRVDVSFRVKGDKGAATVYFTTFRPTQHASFENLRFFAVGDDGQRVSLLD